MDRTAVVIIGAGPSGLLLARLLERAGIPTRVLERKSRAYVEARIRAGVLEAGSVALLREAGVAERLDREGLVHGGFELAFAERTHRIDVEGLTGLHMTVYGQTEVQKDLGQAHLAAGGVVHYEAEDIELTHLTQERARVRYRWQGVMQELECDFVAGCDGAHGVSRAAIPAERLQRFERIYPFGWLGVLADVTPLSEELVYANHERGFALCSMRSRTRSRYYVQCSLDDQVEAWSDDRFWEELARRLPPHLAAGLQTGVSIEKSIAPLRSVVTEPMRYGRLFLVGDAAHIVPPTGAKGLNLAASDVRFLWEALTGYYRHRDERLLEEYSSRALHRVWQATRFSWWFTTLMHRFTTDPFEHRLQVAELENLVTSRAAAQAVAENYVGRMA